MQGWVRKLRGSWLARGFFGLLAVAFVFWGVSNVFVLMGSSTVVAHVGGKPIDVSAVAGPYQLALNQAEQSGQAAPDGTARQQLASDALSQVLRQQVLGQEEQKLGVVVPDSAIRQALAQIPAFQTNGQFDKAKFTMVLQQNDRTPDQFITDMKNNIADRQLVVAAVAGATPPMELLNQLFSFAAEQRFAETASIPFAAQPVPAPPADAVLQRYWRNHPAKFTTPQYRTIQVVILAPELLAPRESVAQADIDAAYARVSAAQPSQALRSVQVISVGDLAASSRLQAAWQKSASWAQMQAMAAKFGASAVELTHAAQTQIPTPALAAAVFSAAPGQVVGPVAGPMGMFIFKVTDVRSSGPDPATLQAQIKQQLQLQKAQADVAQDVDNLQDALAGQGPLDQLPGNLGLTAVEGTLDANGNTPGGEPAPIPGDDALKTAIVKAAFAANLHDPAQLNNGPDGSYFALTVGAIAPPALQAYAAAKPKVLAAWTQDAITREANASAAKLLEAVTQGQNLGNAASAAGFSVTMTPALTRGAPPSGINPQLVQEVFGLQPGQATMQQNATGFTVAALVKVVQPTPAQDPAGFAQLQQAMVKSVQDDMGESFLAGLQARDNVSVDQKIFAQVYQ